LELLACDDEEPYILSQKPLFLYIAKRILVDFVYAHCSTIKVTSVPYNSNDLIINLLHSRDHGGRLESFLRNKNC
jgi:hypothetical protein